MLRSSKLRVAGHLHGGSAHRPWARSMTTHAQMPLQAASAGSAAGLGSPFDPSLPRGMVARPMRWNELKPCVEEGTLASLGKLGRLPEEVMTYRAYRKQVRSAVV